MMTEATLVPTAALPVAAFKTHLRLGSGFADDGLQDGLITGYLRAAMATIEGRIGKALLARDFSLELVDWQSGSLQTLPLAPVSVVTAVTIFDAGGGSTLLVPTLWRLIRDTHRPRLQSTGTALPQVPQDGRIEIAFTAGFGPVWADLPADLAQAVLLLAAEYYEMRHEGGMRESAGLPQAVVTLIERWRNVRVLGGGAA
jgi:uncharacterized phiE125 gp8 family phage protein